MNLPKFDGTKKLEVDFRGVQYGMMDFNLTLGSKSFATNFSDVYDPIVSFKQWLEAICIGVQQCSFWYDPEGSETKFNFESITYDKDVFTVSNYYDDNDIFLSDYVDRKQLVEAFYFGLLEFSVSPEFVKREWEIEYMWERLTAILKIDRETLVSEFSKLEREELKNLLFKADPQYLITYEDTTPEEGFKLYIETTFEGKEPPLEHKRVETPQEWHIPTVYNEWAQEKKKEFVEKCLNETTSGQGGTKIDDFKSEIIENYLRRSQPVGLISVIR